MIIHYDRQFIDFENTRAIPEAIITRFINNVNANEDWHLNIIRHFHESVSDKQISRIISYFKHCEAFMFLHTDVREMDLEVQLSLIRRSRSGMKAEPSIIVLQHDSFFNEHRITAVRIMDRKTWNVKRTVYSTRVQ